MGNYARTALLLEEKASRLARENPRRAYLLALAKACRILLLRDVTPEYCELRAEHIELTAQSLPDGSQARKNEMYLAYQMREKASRLAGRKDSILRDSPEL